MLKNYLTIAVRTLKKQVGYTSINVCGLGLGLAACLLIILYVQDERSYDTFHTKADRIYQVGLDGKVGGRFLRTAQSSARMGPTLVAAFPEVESAVRIRANWRLLVSHGNRQHYEDQIAWADSTYFEIFDHTFLAGDPSTALDEPNTVVITRSVAQTYFGEANPLGQTLRFDHQTDYTVTGVIEDVPSNALFQFDLLGSFTTIEPNLDKDWLTQSLYTYILLREGASPGTVTAKFDDVIETHVAPAFEALAGIRMQDALANGLEWRYFLQPLTDLRLHSIGDHQIGATSDARYLYILGAVAVFILLLACINFMNLSTARSAGRAREVGVRKVLGSDRRQLIGQFLGESVLLSLLAALVAVVLVALLLPLFNLLSGKALVLAPATMLPLLGMLLGIALLCGLLAGLYPAFVLSRFQPVTVLKGTFRTSARGRWLRHCLVVVQFTVSIALLIGTGIVTRQIQYMQNQRLGFAGEQTVVLPFELKDQHTLETFRQTLLQHPGIIDVAASDFVPGHINSTPAFYPEGGAVSEAIVIPVARVSHNYVHTLGLDLVAGRDFDRTLSTDSTDAAIINETTAHEFGWTPEEAVGRRIVEIVNGNDGAGLYRTVIGVVKDFHFESLHQRIRPLVMTIDPSAYYRIAVRVRPDNLPATLAFLENQWTAFAPGYPYTFFFLDQDFNRFYQQEQRLSQVFLAFTGLALIIACLGLFGLAAFMAQQRTKEVGVRKALGASVTGIVLLLSREFTRLVLIAAVLAFPIAYIGMNYWMQQFAYQSGLAPWIFLAAAGTALLIAWLTVSYQSIKAATINPVKALRYE